MYILFTDETNLQETQNAKFFVYGGLIVPVDQLQPLDAKIREIREAAGYRPEDELKFETNARPKHVSIEDAGKAKEAVVGACIELGCKFIAYVVLHAIAKNVAQPKLVEWGANHVIGKFNYFLTKHGAYGIVAIDRLASHAEYKVLVERFTKGLTFTDEGNMDVALDRIKLFASTCANASHASSAMDIVLGSFRYCINNPAKPDLAKAMIANISKVIWCNVEGETMYVLEKGLIFRPVDVKVEKYKAEYSALLNQINALLA